MSDRLVWLPFPVEDLPEAPDGLRYEVVGNDDLASGPPSIGEVRFWVTPYALGRTDASIFAPMTSLEVVQTLSAGVDHIRDAVPAGVQLCNGGGIHDTSTAELAVTLTLASLRDIPGFVRAQGRHSWEQGWRPALADKRVLIVGYGRIGAAIERRLEPFEVEVVRVARTARDGLHSVHPVHPVDALPEILPEVDVVILIVPGTDETRGLFDADMLAAMKDGALLVNVSRGPVVVTDALLAELDRGRLRAALDVTDPEPPPEDHPLWSAPNLLITPHVGGATNAMWPRAYRLVAEQLKKYAAGEPLDHRMTGAY